jgi:hypothetical protein
MNLLKKLLTGTDNSGKNGCWIWKGLAHRLAYKLLKGKIPKGRLVCHSCDTRACCNPKHLWLGTNKKNMEDCSRKNRIAFGEACGRAKLSKGEVLKVRMLSKEGFSTAVISRIYSVSWTAIYYIITRRNWKRAL